MVTTERWGKSKDAGGYLVLTKAQAHRLGPDFPRVPDVMYRHAQNIISILNPFRLTFNTWTMKTFFPKRFPFSWCVSRTRYLNTADSILTFFSPLLVMDPKKKTRSTEKLHAPRCVTDAFLVMARN